MQANRKRSALARDARHQVERYLRGETSFNQLRAWITQQAWKPRVTGDPGAAHLLSAIALRLDEYAAGFGTDDSLKETLAAVLSRDGAD